MECLKGSTAAKHRSAVGSDAVVKTTKKRVVYARYAPHTHAPLTGCDVFSSVRGGGMAEDRVLGEAEPKLQASMF